MSVTLSFDGQTYCPAPRFNTWLEIEDELGSLPALHRRLIDGGWRLAELVAAVQILLAAAGCECDYRLLGDDILRRGADTYRHALERLMRPVTGLADERNTP